MNTKAGRHPKLECPSTDVLIPPQPPLMSHQGTSKPEWRLSSSSDPVDYAEALQAMEVRVQGIQNASASELVWLLEHPPLYTLGTSANATDVLDSALPTYTTGRGGKVTYHGPGQRVAYLMLDLNQRSKDLRAYVHALEAWLILTLRHFDIKAERRLGRIGLWVTAAGEERKIAAIGVRVQKWVTSHGIALNVSPNLRHFQGIVPCGLANYGVTSMHDLGIPCAMDHVDAVLRQTFEKIF